MPWSRSILGCLLLASVATAGDWPQWLGPNRDAASMEKVRPWKAAPKVVWRQPVGEGNSSPVVAGGRVFIHAKVKDKDEEEKIVREGDVDSNPCSHQCRNDSYGHHSADVHLGEEWMILSLTFGDVNVMSSND